MSARSAVVWEAMLLKSGWFLTWQMRKSPNCSRCKHSSAERRLQQRSSGLSAVRGCSANLQQLQVASSMANFITASLPTRTIPQQKHASRRRQGRQHLESNRATGPCIDRTEPKWSAFRGNENRHKVVINNRRQDPPALVLNIPCVAFLRLGIKSNNQTEARVRMWPYF